MKTMLGLFYDLAANWFVIAREIQGRTLSENIDVFRVFIYDFAACKTIPSCRHRNFTTRRRREVIITDPQNAVLGFKSIEWGTEDEPAPKKELKALLKTMFEELTNKKVEDSEDGEEEDDEDNTNEHDLLVDTTYDKFSIATSGEILLTGGGDLLFTGEDAEKVLPKLRETLEARIKHLNRLLR